MSVVHRGTVNTGAPCSRKLDPDDLFSNLDYLVTCRVCLLLRLRDLVFDLQGRIADTTESGNRVSHSMVKRADVLALLDLFIKETPSS
jgi:hypothetical protein